MSRTLIIAGFHRSGTSLTARLLHASGLFLGERLMEPNAGNPTGYFEDRDVIRVHETVLRDNAVTWQLDRPLVPYVAPDAWAAIASIVERRNGLGVPWGFKDPRSCALLGLWKDVVPDARTLIVFRHVSECTASLLERHRRDLLSGIGDPDENRAFWRDPDLAVRMWLAHNTALLAFRERHRADVAVVSWERLVAGAPVVHELERRWSLGLAPVAPAEVIAPELARSRREPQPLINRHLIGEVERVWARLVQADADEQWPQAETPAVTGVAAGQ